MQPIHMTREGYDKLVSEVDYLVVVKRREVAEALKEAVAFGDLAENAEYEAARATQAELESKINQLKDRISWAKVIETEGIDLNTVSIGVKVKVLDELGEEVTYSIVGPSEGDLKNYKISTESPVGKALLGGKVGDVVKVDSPGGIIDYKILKILI